MLGQSTKIIWAEQLQNLTEFLWLSLLRLCSVLCAWTILTPTRLCGSALYAATNFMTQRIARAVGFG